MNFDDAAKQLNCDPRVIAKLVQQGLLQASLSGELRSSDLEQFRRSSRVCAVSRIRREIANDELAEVAAQEAMDAKKSRLLEKLETAVSEGDMETARLAEQTLSFLNEV